MLSFFILFRGKPNFFSLFTNYFIYLVSQSETLIQELQRVDLRDISNLWEEWIKLFF